MSGKSAKKERKEEALKELDYMARRDAMVKDMEFSSEKHKIDVVAILKYTNTGIIPNIALVDAKDKYEHLTEEAKKQNENGSSSTPPPKLEV